jgi:mannose-6-phosphate isomerase-like protein (cupin superfamily)
MSMRLLVVGVDASGRSFLAKQSDVAAGPIPGLPGSASASLFATNQSPPPASPPGVGKFTGNTLPPGHVTWFFVEHQPRAADAPAPTTELHYRNAIDLVSILEGGGDMLLGDGPHPVQAGDCIVMAGTDHRLRPGPQGCRLLAFAIGTPPS